MEKAKKRKNVLSEKRKEVKGHYDNETLINKLYCVVKVRDGN